ncbi:type IVB secretion system protein IcmH/DotU [Inquilinus sp. NPDC058860]|uniref:type IVB secretion system protein IcmH/DotU n=1 Tax=Inquilinus sp. NPDC058860 TaxID=3346652 RepID=UPI0036B25873
MVDDDPFAAPDNPDRTVIRPRPGGNRAAAAETGEPTQSPGRPPTRPRLAAGAGPTEAVPLAPTGVNPLVQAAAVLFALAVRLKNRAVHRDVPLLRQRVVAEVRTFERTALAGGASADAIRAARYALCATIDDLVLNTPWGSQSLWTKQSMVSTFYNETWGGERFFEILDHLMKTSDRNLEVLELFYICLSLGFEGRYRVESRGPSRLGDVRESVFRAIRRRRGEIERTLSPHWVGVVSDRRPLGRLVPLWVIGAAVAAMLVLAFVGFRWALDARLEPVMAAATELPPHGAVVIERPAPVEPPPPPEPPKESAEQRLTRFLEPEIREGLVTVVEDQQSVRVRINGSNLFASASDTLLDDRRPVVDRIGQALETEPGQVVIEGHTDSQAIKTVRFPSNWQLSTARAESVRRILAQHVSDDGRFSVEGKADTEPLAANDTPEARAQNRRIEVVLMKPAGAG